MSDADVATYLGRSLTWLADHRAELEAAGFPSRLALVGVYDRKAVDAWLDRQGGLASAMQDFEADTAWMRAAGNG